MLSMHKQALLKPDPIIFIVLGMCIIAQSQWGVTRNDDLLLWYDFDEIQGATVPDKVRQGS